MTYGVQRIFGDDANEKANLIYPTLTAREGCNKIRKDIGYHVPSR